MGANVGVETPQEQGAAVELGHARAQAVEDAGEFHCYIAPPYDNQAFGKALQVKYLVGGDRVFAAGEIRYMGPATGGNQDFFRRVSALAHSDGMGIDNMAAPLNHLGLDPGQQVVIDGIEPGNLGFLVVAQGGPVEGRCGAVPAEVTGVAEGFGKLGGIYVQFFWYAAHVDAGSAHVLVFRHGNSCAEAGGHACGPDAA